MKIQLAMDVTTTKEAIDLLEEVGDYIDIAEIGSPLVLCEGLHAVKEIRKRFPDKTLLVDSKIADAAYWMAGLAYDAGADIVTVMGAANDYTIMEFVRVAHEHGKLAEVDMMGVENVEKRAQELLDMNVDIIGMHASAEALRPHEVHINKIRRMMSVVPKEKACVANSLTFETMERVLPYQPGIVVISSPILSADDKRAAAAKVKEIFDKYRT